MNTSLFTTRMSPEEKIRFMQEWYRFFHDRSQGWNNKLGSEVSYLMGAVMNDNFILVKSDSPMLQLLRAYKVEAKNRVWKYIQFLDN